MPLAPRARATRARADTDIAASTPQRLVAVMTVLLLVAMTVTGCWVPVSTQTPPIRSVAGIMGDPTLIGKTVHAEGRVLPGSWNGSTSDAYFQIADGEWNGGRGLGVRSDNGLPQDFKEEAFVIVDGTLGSDMTVQADTVQIDPSPPTTKALHTGATAHVRGLSITLQIADRDMPAGMAPGLVTAPNKPLSGQSAFYTLLHIVNSTNTTQPVQWTSRAVLVDTTGTPMPIIGAAFHAVRASAPTQTADEAGFDDPSNDLIDRSDGPETLSPSGEAYILTVFSVPKDTQDLRLQWNPGGAPIEFWVP